ncbi:mannonate dehydratase [Bisgaard Taxon 10/6]|uniref:mannonate dehydratase n=1 Tax=Exercitatus varius TaxID=67857 RepID=UPI00294B045A|nr:mannonate dehydratase [Exercitatus varius]MDG2943702.1 mannonate dehydratase [Exercitatus varius]MDG2961207.1 mannonate dehydratase [Exercitatus varius]
MKTTFRWYGLGNDTIPLAHIKQIPSMTGVVWALHDIPAGEVWPEERIAEVKSQVEPYGLSIDVVESVNIHESIKLGSPDRDVYIENYKTTLRSLGKYGVKVVCYNFMPVFDWIRTDLFKEADDGSTALFYEHARIDGIDPKILVKQFMENSKDLTLPGWEPDRLKHLDKLFDLYKDMTEDKLRENLKYFLEQIIPVAEEAGIRMAIHPDDPPFSVFGLPRIVKCHEDFQKIVDMVDSPANGITLCSGALGPNLENDLPQMIRTFHKRIPFAHIRNIKVFDNGDFYETSHLTRDGSLDIAEIVKAYHEVGFDGYWRPDHGRHIWDEKCRPGYGLYDRALGIMYVEGLWDAYEKGRK